MSTLKEQNTEMKNELFVLKKLNAKLIEKIEIYEDQLERASLRKVDESFALNTPKERVIMLLLA